MTPLTHIRGYAHVAERYGFEEAVFLDAIVFWYRTNKAENRNFRDGRWWTYNDMSVRELKAAIREQDKALKAAEQAKADQKAAAEALIKLAEDNCWPDKSDS